MRKATYNIGEGWTPTVVHYRVAVIGSNSSIVNGSQIRFAEQLGKYLTDQGHTIVHGGMGGVMEAVARGANSSSFFRRHMLIGILPHLDCEPHVYPMVAIYTSLGDMRNKLVIENADIIIAVGGGAGTLTELGFAWLDRKPIAAFVGGGGWSEKISGMSIDDRDDMTIRGLLGIEDVQSWMQELSPSQDI